MGRREERPLSYYEDAFDAEDAGETEKAKSLYRLSIRFDNCVNSRINLARLLLFDGEPRPALDLLDEAILAKPNNPTAAFNKAIALEDLDLPRDAASWYKHAAFLDPLNQDAWFNLCRLCDVNGWDAEAEAAAAEYIKLQPEQTPLRPAAIERARVAWGQASLV